MNIFASARLKPENIKFPKAMSKVAWTVVDTYNEFCKLMETNPVSNVVLDAFANEGISGIKCAYALTEITCDKHITLPTLLIIGPDTSMRKTIEDHIANSKKWIDINRGK
jgi:hypothetical protein